MPAVADSAVTPASTRWRPAAFAGWTLVALLLFASWCWPPTRALWDRADHLFFVALNGRLDGRSGWQAFWAAANLRVIDLVCAGVMLAFVLRADFVFERRGLRAALCLLLCLMALAVLLRTAFDFGVVRPLQLTRVSASLTEPDAVRLSLRFPQWPLEVKDASATSFPGDHAALLLTWALFLSLQARGWRLAAVWAVVLLFSLPRLVAGAHWLTDDVVGGLAVALPAVALGSFTPLGAAAGRRLQGWTAPLLPPLRRLPLIGRWAVWR